MNTMQTHVGEKRHMHNWKHTAQGHDMLDISVYLLLDIQKCPVAEVGCFNVVFDLTGLVKPFSRL